MSLKFFTAINSDYLNVFRLGCLVYCTVIVSTLAMYSFSHIPLSLLILISSFRLILSVPTWEGMNGRSSIGSLIPGVSHIQAMGPVTTGGMRKHLTLHRPGEYSNITVAPSNIATPQLFYINQEQLWLLVNETAVYPVNVHNSTDSHYLPMQLVLGKKKEGITLDHGGGRPPCCTTICLAGRATTVCTTNA
ncbi:hypothetical protein BJ912DRAFT_16373 [Pholiota molesta]|nr:hypothetical protein BJ912DRAFT_16373 [Pholiota molesta]